MFNGRKHFIQLLLLFLVNALSRGTTLLYMSLIIWCLVSTQYTKKKSTRKAPQSMMLMILLFSILYVKKWLIWSGWGNVTSIVLLLILPCSVYIFGYLEVAYRDDHDVVIHDYVYAIVSGCAFHALINILINIGNDRWHLRDYQIGRSSATILSSLNTFVMGILFSLLFEKRHIIIGTVSAFVVFLYSFILGTRTQLMALVLSIIVSACMYFFIDVKDKTKVSYKSIKKVGFVCVMLLIVLVVLPIFETNGLKTIIMDSNLLHRFSDPFTSASDSYRITRLKQGLDSVVLHKVNQDIHPGTDFFYHNYWLDIGKVGGTTLFFIALFISVLSVVHMLRIVIDRNYCITLRYMLLGIYICSLVNYFFEPILEGFLPLHYRFLMLNGMVEAAYQERHRYRINEKTTLGHMVF